MNFGVMPPKKELCRNFQRGSCRYGDHCKFLHTAPQQSKPNNPFGFGVQTGSSFQGSNQQQPMPNPFGFGVQNQKNTQSRGGSDYGSKTAQFKPFENKWTRSAPLTSNSPSTTSQPGSQSRDRDHKCTDPSVCKHVIMDDFVNENPQYKLTCYGHSRCGPCDITGDISYEELRALAYDDAKNGKSMQSIIERERNLVNSKLAEFQSFAKKPSFGVADSTFSGINSSSSTPASGFSQFGQSQTTWTAPAPTPAFAAAPATPPAFAPAPTYGFGQSNQTSSNFVMNSSSFGKTGAFGTQVSGQITSPFGSTNFGGVAIANAPVNPFSSFSSLSSVGNVPIGIIEQPGISMQHNNITLSLDINVDESIWTKAEWKWNAGEIPEEPPPDIYIH